jgi:sugar fermentation stimulation protein A
MNTWLYQYPPLYPGRLLKRYKRFFADIELESGDVITAHCPNTGPMTGISTVGSQVQVSFSNSLTRKLPYTWEMVLVADPLSEDKPHLAPLTWVGVNTAMPNRIVKLAVENRLIPGLDAYTQLQSEVPYGSDRKSRIDLRLTGSDDERPIYVEIKSTTWVKGKVALFPDTVTTRGQKHLRELMALVPEARAVMLYFINRGDRAYFAPGDSADPDYGILLRKAVAAGVEILPCRFEITPVGIRFLGFADVSL